MHYTIFILILLNLQVFSQSQEEILRDLREENVPYNGSDFNQYDKNFYLEKLTEIHLSMGKYLESKEDQKAIEVANQMEKFGITALNLKFSGNAELSQEQSLFLKNRRLRAEAYFNLREFRKALSDSKFIVENHPKSVVFDFTRYAVSLYYSGDEKEAKRILVRAKDKFKNENDQTILVKTRKLLFPDY